MRFRAVPEEAAEGEPVIEINRDGIWTGAMLAPTVALTLERARPAWTPRLLALLR